MRTIKFRAWNIPTKQMFIWGTLQNINYTDSRNIEEEHNHFMQYTGLKDKNGKEIYEGDILEIKNYEKGFGWTTRKAFVFFEDGCFKIDNNNYWNPLVAHVIGEDTDYKGWTAKVIGNIYENPELIKDGGEEE